MSETASMTETPVVTLGLMLLVASVVALVARKVRTLAQISPAVLDAFLASRPRTTAR